MSIGVQGIRQIAVTVSDMDRAVAFYADTLGLDLRFRNDTLAFFDCGETRLLLGAKRAEDADGIVVYFEVSDIFTAVDSLRDSGIQIEKEPECLARMAGRLQASSQTKTTSSGHNEPNCSTAQRCGGSSGHFSVTQGRQLPPMRWTPLSRSSP